MAVKRIVLPVDGSATAEAAARFAEDIARSEGEVVMVLGVVVPIGPTTDEAASVTAAIRQFMTEQVGTEAGRIRAAGIPAEEIVVEADSPHKGILQVAEDRQADVIVMGTHGRTGLVRAVIGSVADKVVRHSTVPVVLVPLKSEDRRD
ncbi:MAG: universal stress protein [Coriobacteriales bacterium]|nr:universal stress protein [Coriobacteriales bacterium]